MKVEKGRIGIFFLFIGLILLALFFTTYEAQGPQVGFFFIGLLVTGLGIYFIRKDWKPAPPSGRFRLLKSPSNNKKEEEEQKE